MGVVDSEREGELGSRRSFTGVQTTDGWRWNEMMMEKNMVGMGRKLGEDKMKTENN